MVIGSVKHINNLLYGLIGLRNVIATLKLRWSRKNSFERYVQVLRSYESEQPKKEQEKTHCWKNAPKHIHSKQLICFHLHTYRCID